MTAPLQKDYRLADHVRACHVDGQVILLDLQRDKYIGVGGPLLQALAFRIWDWPVGHDHAHAPKDVAEMDHWIVTLRAQGMLTTQSAPPPKRIGIVEPQRSLLACDQPPEGGLQWRRIASIACANLIVGRWLKRRRLEAIAAHIARQRLSRLAVVLAARQDQLQSAVGWYLKTRPFVMTSHDECLRDSLTLVHFLAAERLYPRWVIGVRTRPFAAHSWVQDGDLVLNDLHENVRRYTPILIV